MEKHFCKPYCKIIETIYLRAAEGSKTIKQKYPIMTKESTSKGRGAKRATLPL